MVMQKFNVEVLCVFSVMILFAVSGKKFRLRKMVETSVKLLFDFFKLISYVL